MTAGLLCCAGTFAALLCASTAATASICVTAAFGVDFACAESARVQCYFFTHKNTNINTRIQRGQFTDALAAFALETPVPAFEATNLLRACARYCKSRDGEKKKDYLRNMCTTARLGVFLIRRCAQHMVLCQINIFEFTSTSLLEPIDEFTNARKRLPRWT